MCDKGLKKSNDDFAGHIDDWVYMLGKIITMEITKELS